MPAGCRGKQSWGMTLHLNTSCGHLLGCRGCCCLLAPPPPVSPCSGGVCGLGSSREGSLGSHLAERRCTRTCCNCSLVKE